MKDINSLKMDEKALKGSLCELLRNSVYRNNLLIMMIMWSYGSFSFFLIPYFLATFDSNMYLMAISIYCGALLSSFIILSLVGKVDILNALKVSCFLTVLGTLAIILFQLI
jgi:Na+/melibiose symporter-like transporter